MFVHLCVEALVILHALPAASGDFKSETSTLSCLLHILSAMRTNVVIWNLEQSSAAVRPQLSHPTCSLAQAEVSGSDRGEPQHAGTTVHRGRHTGSPAGPAAVLLAHGHAAEGRRRSHTMIHCSSYEDPMHTQVHKHTHMLSYEQ